MYQITSVNDQHHAFTIEFESDGKQYVESFPPRPPERNQLEYAHECVVLMLTPPEPPPEPEPAPEPAEEPPAENLEPGG